MNAYADTSFLLSLYGRDANSPRAAALVARDKPSFFVTEFGEVEFNNAVERLLFSRHGQARWTQNEARAVRDRFDLYSNAGVVQLRPVPNQTWQMAVQLSRQYTAKLGTRTLDVLHVAIALSLRPDVFFTFDKRQWKLAKAVGLRVLPARP